MPKARKAKALKSKSLATKIARAKTVPVMTRVSPKLKAKLKAIAKHSERSEAYIARAAIEAFVDLNEWQMATIRRSLEESRSGVPSIPHEEVEAWIDSLGTDKELPMPRPRE